MDRVGPSAGLQRTIPVSAKHAAGSRPGVWDIAAPVRKQHAMPSCDTYPGRLGCVTPYCEPRKQATTTGWVRPPQGEAWPQVGTLKAVQA